TLPDVPGGDNIVFLDPETGAFINAPFSNGDLVLYDASTDDGSAVVPIAGLQQGQIYRVVKDALHPHVIQFKRGVAFSGSVNYDRDAGMIIRSSGSWVDDAYAVGQQVVITSSAVNNGTY